MTTVCISLIISTFLYSCMQSNAKDIEDALYGEVIGIDYQRLLFCGLAAYSTFYKHPSWTSLFGYLYQTCTFHFPPPATMPTETFPTPVTILIDTAHYFENVNFDEVSILAEFDENERKDLITKIVEQNSMLVEISWCLFFALWFGIS